MKKVVVTGIGAVTSIGNNASDFWNGLISGKSGIKKITRISVDNHDTKVAAEIDDTYKELVKKYWKRRQLNAAPDAVQMGLASAAEAIENCGVDFNEYNCKKTAVVMGIIENSFNHENADYPSNVTLKKMPSLAPALISMKYKLNGASFNISTACASSAYAMAVAKQFIESGLYDMVITGGISNIVSHETITGFNQLLAMSANPDPETACRPFTKNRDGFIMGEGSGAVILESEESALKRNAHIYCEFSGASMYDEAYNLTAPLTDGQGMVESMKLAIENAGIAPEKINYINAHGTSTGLNDAYETAAIKEVFGSNAGNIPVSSIKAAIGHTLGAGGVLEAIACIKAIESGIIPPTIHYDEPAPECDLDYVPNTARKHHVDAALSNSFGFGGHNATLIFSKYRKGNL
ncbi:MAG: beta-ketoacyl-[acyl-carrier-protein] synthase family protein [Ruminococcus sp.]|nr:beta-ketoacyl-[acyl-carrier-protein] synthase family protein [Ruminococcus sp.]MDY3215046.1 beta-ketoacyl-[acyl-carrier-protein] synthase family protein [Ruminococcus sp.]CDF00798.1 3-oxoacyl-(Acyl-carrier-protein) synthase [Ruminococcus sp. CAG:624]